MRRTILPALLLALCASTSQAQQVPSPIRIGVALAQTSNVALLGEEEVTGAKLAEKYFNAKGGVNGTPIQLVFQDTGGDEAGAINAFQNLMNRDKVVGIVGPTLSQQAFSADPLANRAGVPVIDPSNTAKGIPQIGEYICRVSAPIATVAPNAVKQALKEHPGIKKVAILYAQNDAFSTSESGTFQETVKGMGLPIATIQKFQTTDTDFTSQVTAVLGARVDLAIISGLSADGGNLVKQLRQLGFKGPIIGGNGLNTVNIFPVAGKYCDGLYIAQAYSPSADPKNAINAAMAADYKATYKKDPPQFTAQTFTAVQVFVEALRKVEAATKHKITQLDLVKVRQELNKQIRTGSYLTPLGKISISPDGELNQENFYVAKVKMDPDGKGGKYIYVK
jgi:branched-chain amino acid transport system substrate-binding protein